MKSRSSTDDVFLVVLTKTGWWIPVRRQTFIGFLSDFIWSSHQKQPHIAYTNDNLYKKGILLHNIISCNHDIAVLHECTFIILILREIIHVWRTCVVWCLEAFIL